MAKLTRISAANRIVLVIKTIFLTVLSPINDRISLVLFKKIRKTHYFSNEIQEFCSDKH